MFIPLQISGYLVLIEMFLVSRKNAFRHVLPFKKGCNGATFYKSKKKLSGENAWQF